MKTKRKSTIILQGLHTVLLPFLCSSLVYASSNRGEVERKHIAENPHTSKENQFLGQYEISTYRFSSKPNRERLVLEFSKTKSGKPVTVITKKNSDEEAYQIEVQEASLVGAIPEAEINQSFQRKSRYLSSLMINTENNHNGFQIRSELKKKNAKMVASWLTEPYRLVLDLYNNNDSSHHSEDSHENREVNAVHSSNHSSEQNHSPSLSHSRSHTNSGTKQGSAERFLCFPANAQVGLSVIFQSKKSKKAANPMRIDLEEDSSSTSQSQESNEDKIVCYDSAYLVTPSISYHGGLIPFSKPAKTAKE